MKGVMLREPYIPVTVEQVDVDEPRADEVLLKTMATGVCHSDFHFVEGLWTMPMPCVLGHEGAGIVEKVGPGVDYVKPGDHVIACLSAFCGKCEYCMGGRPNLCHRTHAARSEDEPPRLSQNGVLIHQYTNLSTFAEQMLVHESSLVKVGQERALRAYGAHRLRHNHWTGRRPADRQGGAGFNGGHPGLRRRGAVLYAGRSHRRMPAASSL